MMPRIDTERAVRDEISVKSHTHYAGNRIFKNVGLPPKGYVTSEEFRKVSSERIDNICREYGIL